jgi:hypothetical protein
MVVLRPQTNGSSYLNSMQKFRCFYSQGFHGMPNLFMHPSLVFQIPIGQPMLGTILEVHPIMSIGLVQQVMVTTTIVSQTTMPPLDNPNHL